MKQHARVEDLEDTTFELNVVSGMALNLPERVRAVKRMLARHPTALARSEWNDTAIAKWAGVSRETVAKYRRQLNGVEKARDTKALQRATTNDELADALDRIAESAREQARALRADVVEALR